MMKLYNFFRSGTSHRLRIALNLKGISVDYIPVDLRVEEHLGTEFKSLNPQGLVPALVDGQDVQIQSPAIIEWLEEKYPNPPLLPKDINDRAHVRALAAIVGCDIHPVNNRRILEKLKKDFGADQKAVDQWCGQWISDGFNAIEALLAQSKKSGKYCFGDTPTIADVYLIPQIESAKRFNVDLTKWPLIAAIEANCMKLDAFIQAAPAKQVDAG